jgi:hypothetical protein
MSDMKLFHKKSNYVDKQGNEKVATNFFLKIGNMLIPIEVKYFPNKETNIDNQYQARRAVMSSFSEELPAKEKSE